MNTFRMEEIGRRHLIHPDSARSVVIGLRLCRLESFTIPSRRELPRLKNNAWTNGSDTGGVAEKSFTEKYGCSIKNICKNNCLNKPSNGFIVGFIQQHPNRCPVNGNDSDIE